MVFVPAQELAGLAQTQTKKLYTLSKEFPHYLISNKTIYRVNGKSKIDRVQKFDQQGIA